MADRHHDPSETEGAGAEGENRFYFRQLLSGQDFARTDPVASQMVNFVYAIGDRSTGDCVLVDPAYAVDELVDIVEHDGLRVSGVLATHYHADHIGGSMMGFDVEGISALLKRQSVPIHVQKAEVPWIVRTTGVSETDLAAHDAGDIVRVGDIEITLVHTPGHTPGSQCFLVDGRLVSGDTLFLDGCGRTDLPGGDMSQLIESLGQLSKVDDDVVLYPGHRYSAAPSASMGAVKRNNFVFDQILGH